MRWTSFLLALLTSVLLAGCGLLTTVGVIVAMDTFGPVSDNAQGIAEMSGDVGAEGAQVLTELDAVGNTTKAITKGIAIATAVLAATEPLFPALMHEPEFARTRSGSRGLHPAVLPGQVHLKPAPRTQSRGGTLLPAVCQSRKIGRAHV